MIACNMADKGQRFQFLPVFKVFKIMDVARLNFCHLHLNGQRFLQNRGLKMTAKMSTGNIFSLQSGSAGCVKLQLNLPIVLCFSNVFYFYFLGNFSYTPLFSPSQYFLAPGGGGKYLFPGLFQCFS